MSWRLIKLNKSIRRYDRNLFAKEHSTGRIDVYRKTDSITKACWVSENQPPLTQYIFSLTDNWKITGKPVEWGTEPVMAHLSWMDSWRDDSYFQKICENREREEKLSRKRFKNEARAIAYDIRGEFAKATNDLRLGD